MNKTPMIGNMVRRKAGIAPESLANNLTVNKDYAVEWVSPSGKLLVLKDFLCLVHVDDVEVTFGNAVFNTAMVNLLNAYHEFRREAMNSQDPAVRKAALEDAAEVGAAIGAIENGLNRNKYDEAHLEEVAKDE